MKEIASNLYSRQRSRKPHLVSFGGYWVALVPLKSTTADAQKALEFVTLLNLTRSKRT